jgi:hypothetical protein
MGLPHRSRFSFSHAWGSPTARVFHFHTRGALPPLAFFIFACAGLSHRSRFSFSHARGSPTARIFRFHTRGAPPPLAFFVFACAGLSHRSHFSFSHARAHFLSSAHNQIECCWFSPMRKPSKFIKKTRYLYKERYRV